MRFWEDNKLLVSVVGGFLVIYLLVSLISLLPNAAEVNALQVNADNDYGSVKDKLFPERISGKETIETLLNEYKRYNKDLDNRLVLLDEMVSRPFQEPFKPVVERGHFGSGVRAELDLYQGKIMVQAGSRGVTMQERALSLIGKELPAALTEDMETDIDWLQQIRVANEFTSLLLKLSTTADKKLCIKEIQSLETSSKEEIFLKSAEASEKGEVSEAFLYLYPLKAELLVSLEGVMHILDACSKKENFFVVRGLSIDSDPNKRTVEVREQLGKKNLIGKQRVTKWNEHYYLVTLDVARLQVNLNDELKGIPAGPLTEEAPKPKEKSKGLIRF